MAAPTTEQDNFDPAPKDIELDSVILDVCFHPGDDQNLLACSTIDGDVLLYKYNIDKENEEFEFFDYHTKACRGVQFSECGKRLFSISKDKSFNIIDLENDGEVERFPNAHESAIYSLRVIDEYLVATGDDDGTVKVWDFRSKSVFCEFKECDDYISDIVLSPDNKLLLATSGEGVLTAFNIRAKRMEMQSEPLGSDLTCGVFMKHDRKLVTGCAEGVIHLFNNGEWGNMSDRFPGHPESIDCMAKFSENIVCTGSEDGIVRAVSILPNRFVGVIGEHKGFPVESLALSNDGTLLASCSHDHKIKFWNVAFLNDVDLQPEKKANKSFKSKRLSSAKTSRNDFFDDLGAQSDQE